MLSRWKVPLSEMTSVGVLGYYVVANQEHVAGVEVVRRRVAERSSSQRLVSSTRINKRSDEDGTKDALPNTNTPTCFPVAARSFICRQYSKYGIQACLDDRRRRCNVRQPADNYERIASCKPSS